MQLSSREASTIDLKNPTLIEPLQKLDEIGRTIVRLLKGK
jgi:hypothetical protein